jgi:hypothetical protein
MALRRRNPWIFVFIIVLGAIVGSAIGHILGIVLPQGAVKTVFLKALTVGIPTFTLNLAILNLTLGFMVHINLVTVIFIVLLAYLLRWFYW